MIRFRVNTPVTIIEGFDEKTDNITDEYDTTFKQGGRLTEIFLTKTNIMRIFSMGMGLFL